MTLRAVHAAARAHPWELSRRPVQLGLGGDPWRVMLASIMLNRTSIVQVRPVLQDFLNRWPFPEQLAEADPADVADVMRTLGLHNQRGRRLVQLAREWQSEDWDHAMELIGVGPYVLDALSIFVLGVPSWRSGDAVLGEYLLGLDDYDSTGRAR